MRPMIFGLIQIVRRIRRMTRYGTSAVTESQTGMWTNGGARLRRTLEQGY